MVVAVLWDLMDPSSFPPEEFITNAKFIAAQNPEMMSDDFKGILFDQYTDFILARLVLVLPRQHFFDARETTARYNGPDLTRRL